MFAWRLTDMRDSAIPAHNDNFNLIRLVLAIGVLFSHSFALAGAREPNAMGNSFAAISVHLFFLLSGYMIAQSRLRLPLGRFGLHRFLRIVPGLVVALLFTRALATVFGDFQNNALAGQANGSLWTIPWEILCYAFCVGLSLLGCLTRDRIGVILCIVLIVSLSRFDAGSFPYKVITPMLLFFVAGMFIALTHPPIRDLVPSALVVGLVVLFEPKLHLVQHLIALVPMGFAFEAVHYGLTTIGYLFAASVLTIWAGAVLRPLAALTTDLSYGVYIYAFPIQQACASIFGGYPALPWLIFTAALPLTLVVSAASWRFVEAPALRLKARPGPVGVSEP